ncbi:MAG: hypothetical protein ACFFG0_11295 [Candidatus Thorarchaeota archaeon]
MGSDSGSSEALLLMSNIIFLGNVCEARNITLEVEELIDSLEKEISVELIRERAVTQFIKAWVYNMSVDYNKVLESALLSLSFRERLGKKRGIAAIYLLIVYM